MKSNYQPTTQARLAIAKAANPSSATAMAIGKKLLEIKRISGAGEMTELNMALFRHLK